MAKKDEKAPQQKSIPAHLRDENEDWRIL